MILFEPGPPTPPLHRRHPIVKQLDRIIRRMQFFGALNHPELLGVSLALNEKVRKALVGKKLRPNNRTGARARQRRLGL